MGLLSRGIERRSGSDEAEIERLRSRIARDRVRGDVLAAALLVLLVMLLVLVELRVQRGEPAPRPEPASAPAEPQVRGAAPAG